MTPRWTPSPPLPTPLPRPERDWSREAAAVGYEQCYLVTGRPRTDATAQSLPLLDRAIAHLDPSGALAARAFAARAQARFFAGDTAAAFQDVEHAVAIAEEAGEPGPQAAALNTYWAATWSPDARENGIALTERIAALAEWAGDIDLELEALYLARRGAARAGSALGGRGYSGPLRVAGEPHPSSASAGRAQPDAIHAGPPGGGRAAARALARSALELSSQAGNIEGAVRYAESMLAYGTEAEARKAVTEATKDIAPWMFRVMGRLSLSY
jgi:hypothetical protein